MEVNQSHLGLELCLVEVLGNHSQTQRCCCNQDFPNEESLLKLKVCYSTIKTHLNGRGNSLKGVGGGVMPGGWGGE